MRGVRVSGDDREVLIQLVVGVLTAAVYSVALLRLHRMPRRRWLITAGGVVLGAILALGVLEARVLAAVVAGAAAGMLVAGSIGHRTSARPLIGALLVALFPLAELAHPANGDSIMGLTRNAAESSGGSWVLAWERSWQLLVETGSPDRILLAVAWTLLLVAAFAAVAAGSSRILTPRLATEPAPVPA